MKIPAPAVTVLLASTLIVAGCKPRPAVAPSAPAAAVAAHEHHAPHGGTAVVLGEEAYHLEFVRDAATGLLQAFVLDGEMENFVRSPSPELELTVTVEGRETRLVLSAVADAATGEKVGDTALFQGSAEWLKTTLVFDAVLDRIEIRGSQFTRVAFNFPHGNEGGIVAPHADAAEPSGHAGHAKAHRPHQSPRGGTLVQVGKHQYNIDLVLDATTGRLQAYVVGAHAKGVTDLVRIAMPSFTANVTVGSERQTLRFLPSPTPGTTEKLGDCSRFEAQADWLKASPRFSGAFTSLEIADATFADVTFEFFPPGAAASAGAATSSP